MQSEIKFVKNTFYLVAIIAMIQIPGLAEARDTSLQLSISDAMNTDTAKSFTGVEFYFGDQTYQEPKRFIGNYTSKKTTNAFGKTDEEACRWAFLSAIKSFYERALREGGNAVVKIKSITTGKSFESTDQFECRAGNIVAKVYLQADVVELE